LSSSLEAALLPLVNKGVLSRERFKYLVGLLPKSTNTVATNKGKMKALRREFGMEMKSSPTILMKDPAGQLRKVDRKDFDSAKQAGYAEVS